MVDPKKHHFSPVFYLKRWCNADLKVVEYSRPYRKVVVKTVSPEATGFKRFLYTLDEAPDEEKQYIEKKYMAPAVDNRGAVALEILIGRDGDKLTDDIRSDWTRFLLASLNRSPDRITNLTAKFREMLRTNLNSDLKLYAELHRGDPATTPYEWIERNRPSLVRDTAKLGIIANLIENQKLGDMIFDMKWSTFDLSRSTHELLTSDAPLLRTTGLRDQNCLIAFPLSPRFLFIATNDRKTDAALLACGSTAIVRWVNDIIVRAAEHYVYGRTDSHRLFVERRLCLAGNLRPCPTTGGNGK